MTQRLDLNFRFQFEDLYDRDGLQRLDQRFLRFLQARDPQLHDRLTGARATPDQISGKAESDLIVALAPELEDFVAELFRIEREVRELQIRHDALAPLYSVKRQFVQ